MFRRTYEIPAQTAKYYPYRGKKCTIIWREGDPFVVISNPELDAEEIIPEIVNTNELKRKIKKKELIPVAELPKGLSPKELTWKVGEFLYSKLSTALFALARKANKKKLLRHTAAWIFHLGDWSLRSGYRLTQRSIEKKK